MQTKMYSLALAILLSVWAIAGAAAEPQAAEPAKTCLSLWMIEDLDILDNQNLAFRMKNDDYYLNRLPHVCPTLDRTRAIMYRTPLNSLCSMDIITVLENVADGFQPLDSCGLGKFQPATKEEIQSLTKDRKAAHRGSDSGPARD